ncbi:MAG TPA: hypothetical protein VN256_07425 [Pyrinomonadaceae bacterium]|nr:hypothetical protein [Pyrinomonadaceae bacterium]
MPASLMRQLFSADTSKENLRRRIDDHYHLEMIADNSRQLVEYQTEAFQMQREAAIANLRGLAEIANRQDRTNDLLYSLVEGVGDLNHSVKVQNEVLQQGFKESAQLLLQQQHTLEQIADVLSRPYETQVLELLREADRALTTGMKSLGRDRREEFADASRLLREVLANPIGSRNYVAWFQMGWLKWKHEQNITEAEEAFYQASRLSAPKADLYHTRGLSHLAYMQYFEAKYSDAYATIHQALRLSPDDHDIRYDAARYAARDGREVEALDLLDKCIEQEPQTFVLMFTERDFLVIREALIAFGARKLEESRAEAQGEIEEWLRAVEITRRAEAQAECTVSLPAELVDSIPKAAEDALRADYVTAVGLIKKAVAEKSEVLNVAREALGEVLKNRAAEERRAAESIERVEAHKATRVSNIKKEYQEILKKEPEYSFGMGLGFGIVWLIAAGVLFIFIIPFLKEFGPRNPIVEFLDENSLKVTLIVGAFLVLFGDLTLHIVDYAKWEVKKRLKERAEPDEIYSVVEKASRELSPLKKRLGLAEKQREKAEEALRYFTEQTQARRP